MILFVHGWPDDETLFAPQVAHFSKTHTAATVRLPWFSSRRVAELDGKTRGYSRWGYDFDVLGAAVVDAARRALAQAEGLDESDRQVILVGHDWGAVVSQMAELQAPDLFRRLVLIEVTIPRWFATGVTRKWKEIVIMVGVGLYYMFWVMGYFLVAQIGVLEGFAHARATRIGRYMQRVGGVSEQLAINQDADAGAALYRGVTREGTHALSGYPYYYMMKSYARGVLGLGLAGGREVAVGARLDAAWTPRSPTLFVLGGRKKTNLHDVRWVARLGGRGDGSKAVTLDGGHWVPVECADELNHLVSEWIK